MLRSVVKRLRVPKARMYAGAHDPNESTITNLLGREEIPTIEPYGQKTTGRPGYIYIGRDEVLFWVCCFITTTGFVLKSFQPCFTSQEWALREARKRVKERGIDLDNLY